jgi:hypothetical protein
LFGQPEKSTSEGKEIGYEVISPSSSSDYRGPFPFPFVYAVAYSLYWGIEKRAEMFEHFFNVYGDTYATRTMAGPNIITTRNADNVRHFTMTNFSNYVRNADPNLFGLNSCAICSFAGAKMGKLLFGDGIFLADGDTWNLQRQVAAPLFKKSRYVCN